MMTPEDYAVGFKLDLETAALLSERSRHADAGGIGASSFGCREEMRRTLMVEPPSDSPDMSKALIGTYVDEGITRDRKAANPHLIVKAEVVCTLYPQLTDQAGRLLYPDGYSFPVHPDEIDPDEPSTTNYKTKDGLAAIRRGLAEQQYRFQRHLEYLAAFQAGLVPEKGIARNVFIDRSGRDPHPHVEQEPFSATVIQEATEWLDDVLYAKQHREEAMKDRPRVFCKDYCKWFSVCRLPEIDIPEITDPALAELVDALGEADLRMKAEKELVDELKKGDRPLAGLTGRTERFQITSKWVNSERQTPHWRVEVEKIA